jgi:hypothetical protein
VAAYSSISWPLGPGAPVYAQVDSYNADTTYGAVLERHEIRGEPYNNVAGPVVATGLGSGKAAEPNATGGGRPHWSSNLPPRP